MEAFIKALIRRLTDIGFIVEQTSHRSISVDGVYLSADWLGDDENGRQRILFMESRFMIRTNGDIPNIDKAVGLAVQKVARHKKHQKRMSMSKGKDATILVQPGGFTLTIKFQDDLSASAALDCLMENGFVAPSSDKPSE